MISAISVLDNSRWGAREKKKERHRSKELLASKKSEGCGDNDEKHSASGSKSQLSTSQSSSLAGSSELDVWSPIQKHFEEDINHLLSNVKPSKTCHNLGYRSSINILDTERSSKPRTKLVHQIRSDGALVVARRASSESMTSIFYTSDMQAQQFEQETTKDSTRLSSSCSFGEDKANGSSNAFSSSQEKNVQHEKSKSHGHKRGLSIKGSCRRQWLRNQSKMDKSKKKIDISKDNNTLPEDGEASVETPERAINVDAIKSDAGKELVASKEDGSSELQLELEMEDQPHESSQNKKDIEKKKRPRSVKATVEF